jgi:catecholate siderophore receptor
MRSFIALTSACSLMGLGAPAIAADSAADAERLAASASAAADAADQGEEILVQGERPTYGIASTATATKTDTPVKDIPQALTVITEAQIEDQLLRSVGELLYFVPGATPGTGESNRDQITLRGNNTTADFFRDGIRDDVQYFRDFYNVERVEVLKGPNAMIFGRGGGGGVINRVTKRSSLRAGRDFALVGDSEGGLRLTGDVDYPLGRGLGLRVNGLYENGESFRRHVELERYAINPTLGWAAGPDTRVDVSYEYLRDRRTADRGVPSQNGEPLDGFDRTFFGDPDLSFARAEVQIATLAVEHRIGSDLTLRNRTLFGDYDKFYQNIYPNSAVSAGGTVTFAAYNDVTKRRNLFSQTDLVWNNRLGGIDQTLLVGFEVGGSKGRNQRRNGVFAGSAVRALDSVTFDAPVTFVANGNNARVETGVAAIYAQDQIRPTDWLEIVAGLRFDRLKVEVLNRTNGLEFERVDELWSPRLGLVLKPLSNLSIYGSYSRSYLPQSGDQFNSLSLTAESLKPERFDNYEVGAKWEPVPGLLATIAIYQLDRSNVQARDPANPALTVLAGAQRARGIEVGLERSLTDRWLISAGYALQDAEITKDIGTSSVIPEGREVPLVPKHSFSLWNRYEVTDRLGLGLGMVARSKSYASFSNNVKLPGYARVDAAVFYELRDGIEAQLNVENLFDADYFPTAHNDNNIAPGAPFTVKGALRLNL